MLLDSIHKHNVFTKSEIKDLENNIYDVSTTNEFILNGKKYNNKYGWNFYDSNTHYIRNIIEKHLPKNSKVTASHILESVIPFEIHNDINHTGDINKSQYTIIIPLENYNSQTFVFNEYSNKTNEFDDFKMKYKGKPKLRMSKETVLKLTHCHPKDLLYLTLKETFDWTQGSIFAFDRKYYHCSDNYLAAGETFKRAILLRTCER